MRFSQAFIPTLKEAPKDATTASHVLLLRAAYVRMIGAGIYEFLPLGVRVLHKIANVVREEMNRAGAQEVLMPAMLPAEYFRETGRYDLYGDVLIRMKDRKGGEYHLGPTHEEIITDMVRRDTKSYRQLPQNLYQIQAKFRDEPRPRAGLLRCREFTMKDAYSFDVDEAGAMKSYETMRATYRRIFERLGLDYRIVQADSGAIGGKTSAEFQVLAQSGEDAIVACGSCEYAANVEVATTRKPSKHDGVIPPPPERVETPGKKTIEDVSAFLGVPARATMKALMFHVTGAAKGHEYALAFVRGDRGANEIKFQNAIGAREVTLARPEVVSQLGFVAGSIGPIGLPPQFSGPVYVDEELTTGEGFVSGSNMADSHTRNVVFGRDYQATAIDFRQVGDGDVCPNCGGALKSYRGIEGGHIFVLGTHYSSKMGATFLDQEGKEKPIVMGCYGIGVSRLVATAIEQHHDADGIRWPLAIAPYHVVVVPAGKEPELTAAADTIYEGLRARGVEVLLDDRDERPGVKFKDADLIGVPIRVVVGKKSLAEQKAEVKLRTEKDVSLVPLAEVVDAVVNKITAAGVHLHG
jgi:prolyl-tRNA synthetase